MDDAATSAVVVVATAVVVAVVVAHVAVAFVTIASRHDEAYAPYASELSVVTRLPGQMAFRT